MVALAAVAGLSGVSPARAAHTNVLPRAGQVGIGIQGGYGMMFKTGYLGDFSRGPEIAVRLRYRMRYERAIGLSFEGQRMDIRTPEAVYPPGASLPGRTNVRVILSGADLYQMFGTRTRTTKLIGISAGLAQTSSRTLDGDTFYRQEGSDGAYVGVSAGIERFIIHSWALDLSTRYHAIFLPGDRSHQVQVALGVIFYAGY
jgi:hypothetical protein